MEHQQRHDRTRLSAGRFIFIHCFCSLAKQRVGNGSKDVYANAFRYINSDTNPFGYTNSDTNTNVFRYGHPDANAIGHSYPDADAFRCV